MLLIARSLYFEVHQGHAIFGFQYFWTEPFRGNAVIESPNVSLQAALVIRGLNFAVLTIRGRKNRE